jgi:Flp pilus assembly pilin Flp
MLKRLWLDEGGAILSAELCLIMVLLVIGMIVGLTALRDAVDYQLADIAGAIGAIDASYSWTGLAYSATAFGDVYTGSAIVADSKFCATFDLAGTAGAAQLISVLPATATKDAVTAD